MLLVFGRSGQVATELAALPETQCLGREEADLSNPEACAAEIRKRAPAAVINAAAYTAVDRAEDEEALATKINGQAPAAMAEACAALQIPLVHISTDYVFDGSGSAPWAPDANTAPLGAYGRSKLVGEIGIRRAGVSHAVFRTSWVVSAHGSNFVKTMLRLGAERDQLNVVADQVGGPTPARAIAAACHDIAGQLIADPTKSGTYHFAGSPDCSWADFARAIFQLSGIDCIVNDIPSEAYPTPAARPANSRLDCGSLSQTFGIARPAWREALTVILAELGQLKADDQRS